MPVVPPGAFLWHLGRLCGLRRLILLRVREVFLRSLVVPVVPPGAFLWHLGRPCGLRRLTLLRAREAVISLGCIVYYLLRGAIFHLYVYNIYI